MKGLCLWIATAILAGAVSGVAFAEVSQGDADVRIADTHTPEELLTSEEAFAPFASRVKEVDQRLLSAARTTEAQMKVLRTIQVHLALHYADAENALAAATAIRDSQGTPAERAVAGLSAEAMVAAERTIGETTLGPHFPAEFEREFSKRLAQLPRTPEVRILLVNQRKKIAGLSHSSIRAELLEKLGPVRSALGYSLAEADQIVRAHHQYTDLLSIRTETLRALDQALK